MTLAEISAQLKELLGLKEKVTALEGSSATAAQLTAEVEARKASDAKVLELEGKLAKVSATAPPPPADGKDANPHADAIAALEKAITVLKATSPAPEKGDKDTEGDAKAEDDADSADEAEAEDAMAKKNHFQVLAVRSRQFARKQAYKDAMTKKVSAITMKKAVTAEIARLGMAAPLALNKDGKNPILAEASSRRRAHKLTASGFNEMPSVAALNAQLGRAVRN
jgi:hypothetical protein